MEHIPQKEKGFSLVELIVAVGLFTLIVTVTMGALLTMVHANQRAQNLNAVMHSLNFTLESMSRAIRFGTDYYCGESQSGTRNCNESSALPSFSFTNQAGDRIVYSIEDNRIMRSVNGALARPLTGSDLSVNSLAMQFMVFDAESVSERAYVIIVASGNTAGGNPQESTSFGLQTTIAQRN